MISTRFIVTCGVLGGIAIALAIAGYFCGIPLVEWKMRALGAPQVVLSSPSEPAGIQLATALMFAWFGISAIVTVAIHRWRRRADASALAVIAYFSIPFAILVGYIVLRTSQLAELVGSEPRAMLSLTALGPGTEEARLVVFASICVWIFIGVRKPPKF